VESICDTVTVMNKGRSLYSGSVNDLQREVNESFEDAVLRMLDSDGGALYE
jgi:ABC-type Na+ transport system, ATPase component